MEQITPSEWAKEQLKRAPSFAIATALVTLLLVVSAFVEYSSARGKPEALAAVQAELEPEEEQKIEQIDEDIDLARPDAPPGKNEPVFRDEIPPVTGDDVADDPVDPAEITGDEFEPEDVVRDPVLTSAFLRIPVIGIQAPTAGLPPAFKNRTPERKRRIAAITGMPPGGWKAIRDGLRWLKKAQDRETGGWSVTRWGGAKRDSTAGVTGLALLAFLGDYRTDRDPEFGKVVRKAVELLLNRQQSEGEKRGWFGESMYTQGICTMALSEASALLQNPRLRREARRAAQDGLDYILARQPAHGGFSYSGAGNDMSVTGWQVMAIKSAIIAKLRVSKAAREKVNTLLRVCMSSNYATPYRFDPSGRTTGGTPRMTAVSLVARLFMGHRYSAPDCAGQAKWLTRGGRHLQVAARGADYYYIYYVSMAMFQMGGRYWQEWNRAFNKPLIARQVRTGPNKGSWAVEGSAYGRHGGRVYTTAMGLLSLEVYFKHLPMYRRL